MMSRPSSSRFRYARAGLLLASAGLLAVTTMQATRAGAPGSAPTYRDVAPILQARCTVCHNKDTVAMPAVSAGLALDSYAALKAASVGARPIYTVGKSGQSEMIRRMLATSPTLLMPKGGPALPPEQIALFRRWIDAGAPAGALPAEAQPKTVDADALPIPGLPATRDVTFATRIAPTAEMKRKDTPDGATLAFALRIGPLPPLGALAFSPDGKKLAIGGYRSAMIWDTVTGHLSGSIMGQAGPVQSISFRPDGAQIAVAGGAPGSAGEAHVYDAKTLAPVGPTLSGHTDQIFCIAWSPDGKRLATASQDRTARLWEWPSGKTLNTFKDHGDAVTKVCFSPDGKAIYTACMDHNLRRFDTADGHLVRTYNGHEDGVMALAISPGGAGLVSGGQETELRWWNPETGDNTSRQGGHNGPVNDLAFSKDGKLLVSASADHTVRLWDGGNGTPQRALEGAPDWLYATAISPDGKMAVGCGADGATRIWDVPSGRLCLILLAWPPSGKSAAQWLVLTPAGYFDASPAWAAQLQPQFAGHPLTGARLTAFMRGLHQPQEVAKAWQAADIQPASIPAPVAPIAKTPKTR